MSLFRCYATEVSPAHFHISVGGGRSTLICSRFSLTGMAEVSSLRLPDVSQKVSRLTGASRLYRKRSRLGIYHRSSARGFSRVLVRAQIVGFVLMAQQQTFSHAQPHRLFRSWSRQKGCSMILSRFRKLNERSNQSPEPTAVAAAVAIHVASRRWLSFGR